MTKSKNRCKICNKIISRRAMKCKPCHNKTKKITNSFRHNASIGNAHYWKGKKRTLRTIEKIKKARAKQVVPIKDTSIEVKIQNFLKEINLEFITHQYMEIEHAYQCDIFIPCMNIVIECDGDWWHGNPEIYKNLRPFQKEQVKKDTIRTKELIESGFEVIRLWESEIKILTLEMFVHKLLSGFKEEESLAKSKEIN